MVALDGTGLGGWAHFLSTSNFAPVVKVFRGSTLSSLEKLAEGACCNNGTYAMWDVTNNETYYFSVDSYNENGEFTGAANLASRPSNDNFTNRWLLPPMTNIGTAADIILFTSASNSDRFATKEIGEPPAAPPFPPQTTMGMTLWWSWIAPVRGLAVIRVSSTNLPITANFYQGTALTNLIQLTTSSVGLTDPREQVRSLPVNAGDRIEIVSDRPSFLGPADVTVSVTEVPSPANDNFISRFRLEGYVTHLEGRLEAATIEPGEPFHGSAGQQRQSLWWEWTCPNSGPTTIAVTYSGLTSPRFAVYTGDTLTSLVLVTNGGSTLSTNATFSAIAGTNYKIAVATSSSTAVPFSLSLLPGTVPQVAWITPSQNAIFPVGSTIQMNVAATDPDGIIAQVEFRQNGVRVGIDTTEPFSAELTDIQYGTHVLSAVAWDDDGWTSVATIIVDVPQSNDNFANRILLDQYPITVRGTNAGATYESMEPVHSQPGFGSVWWSWTAPTTGRVQIAVHGDDGSALLGVYTGDSLPLLTPVVSAAGIGRNAFTTFDATAGTAYQIAVDSPNLRGTTFSLSLLAIPANDNFTARSALISDAFVMRGYNYGATVEPGEPHHFGSPRNSVWWSWTSPYTGPVWLGVSNNFSSVIAIYTGNSLTNLALVKSDTTTRLGRTMTFPAQAGVTYAFAVDGTSTGQFGDVEIYGRPDGLPAITQVIQFDDELILTIRGLPGRMHRVDSSVDLENWEAGPTTMLSTDSAVLHLPIKPADGGLFYRIVLLP